MKHEDIDQSPIWWPGLRNIVAKHNPNYFHSLWLGTIGLALVLPEMLILQTALPIVTVLFKTAFGLIQSLLTVAATIFMLIVDPLSRIMRTFIYGLFGYLNTKPIIMMLDQLPPGMFENTLREGPTIEDEERRHDDKGPPAPPGPPAPQG